MARGLDTDSAAEVHVDVPVRVLDEGTFRERDVDGKGDLHGVRDELLLPRRRGFRLRSRWDRNDLRSVELLLHSFRHGIVARARTCAARPSGKGWDEENIGFLWHRRRISWSPRRVAPLEGHGGVSPTRTDPRSSKRRPRRQWWATPRKWSRGASGTRTR